MENQMIKYLGLCPDDGREAMRVNLKDALFKKDYPHYVDDVMKIIKEDLAGGQRIPIDSIKIHLGNMVVVKGYSQILLPLAIKDAVSFINEHGSHFHSLVEKMIKEGRYEEIHDANWTGD